MVYELINDCLRERIARNNNLSYRNVPYFNGNAYVLSMEDGESFECMRLTINDGYITFMDFYPCTEDSDGMFVEILFADYPLLMERHEWAKKVLTSDYNATLEEKGVMDVERRLNIHGDSIKFLLKTVEQFHGQYNGTSFIQCVSQWHYNNSLSCPTVDGVSAFVENLFEVVLPEIFNTLCLRNSDSDEILPIF